jgi:hypothetical protein
LAIHASVHVPPRRRPEDRRATSKLGRLLINRSSQTKRNRCPLITQ